ncbi:MAG: PIG-L family deacetylase [Ilumatobacteraceae bacterium]
MGTLVCFHAHPDDEAIATGGSMARAHEEGHRVVLVVATDGRHGEAPADLADGETLADRRRIETERSADVLGVDRVVFLGYADSGMTGWEQNADVDSFHAADLDEAAGRLASILREEAADVLTTYDWHGTYGHPDHVKVNRVGARAAERVAGTVAGQVAGELPALRVCQATVNRDELVRLIAAVRDEATDGSIGLDFDPEAPADDGNPFGSPESEITLAVDVTSFVAAKRAAIAAHRSQVSDSTFFLAMPDDQFAATFGREWFIESDRSGGPPRVGWLFETADDRGTTP